jgi:hypothetical protein
VRGAVWNQEWRASNTQRNYPLADDATGLDATGTFTLPQDFLTGLRLAVSAASNTDPTRFYIYSVGVFAAGYAVTVAYDTGSVPELIATVQVPTAGFTRNATFPFTGTGNFYDAAGLLTVGSLDGISSLSPGLFTFAPAATYLDTDAICLVPKAVTALTVINGQDRSAPLTGDIELVAGTNMNLLVNTSFGDPTVTYNAISGAGLNTTCDCEGGTLNLPCITSINGVTGPDITITGDICLQVTDTDNGIVLADKCCTPCCGCAELEVLTRDFERYRQQSATLAAVLTQLEGSVTQTDAVVLGSRLGDRGCTTC